MQVNNGAGHLHLFVPSPNGSAGYVPARVMPVRSPPPLPLKPSAPPPARPAAPPQTDALSSRALAQNRRRKNTYICTGVVFGVFFLTLIIVLSLTSVDVIDENCPDHNPKLRNWHPGHDLKKAVVVRNGDHFRLAASATLQSITIQSGGLVVFADNKEGSKNITLRTRHILIEDGGALHIGGPKCRYRSHATVTLVGRSDDASIVDVPGFGRKFIGVRAGGTLEIHGTERPSWTLLTRTVPASGLAAGSYSFQRNFSRGINLRVVDQDTGAVLYAERFDTHELHNDSRRLGELLRTLPAGRVVALAVGDSAVKSLLHETKITIQNVLGSTYVNDLKYRQAWALVSVVGGGNGSCAEDTREFENHDTAGRALARRELITADGVRFTVTAYSEWRSGFPISGFAVDAVDAVVLNVQEDVSSWRSGQRIVVSSTDYSMHQAEEFTLLPCPHCTKRQLRIQGKPQYTHMGEIVDGVDMRAEVALLTRNIVIQGEMEGSCYANNWCQYYSHDTFGGHVKILGNFSSVHLSQVEMRFMGQQAVMGRYPIHFHICADVDQRGGYDPPTYLDSLSIHHSYSRCVTVHATNGLLVRDTVGYDALGHCFFLEDGIEQRNTFFHNLGLVTRPGTLLPTDRNDTMCTDIRGRVHQGYTPQPATECKAVSTFWIANPNNNLISNAAAGSQDAGIWYIFHSSSTGDSHGLVPDTKAELTPLGIFYNNRVHSNFKAGLFIDKGVKTTNASAADPREYLCLHNNARFRPHENSDPSKPRVAALIDTLISFKNNDLGAWIRGGDIIIQNSGFADNGVGLSFASDGSYPKDVGSSQEVSESLFVGESRNRGTNGGQNKYWGIGGVDGRNRTLPRNKTFPIRGFQIYDGPMRLYSSTFSSYTHTSERYSSAVGFSLKNSWQITPRNNLSALSFLPSVTLRAFFGREENDLDGDKTSIFHDVDGSLSGYPDTYVVRADNHLVQHPECVCVPLWNGCVCSARYAQVYIKTQGVPNLSLSIIRDEYPNKPLLLRGIYSQGVLPQQYQPVLMMSKSYTLHWSGQAPRETVLSLVNFDMGDWALLGLCYPSDTVFQVMSDIYDRQSNTFDGMEDYGSVSSLSELEKRSLDRKYFFDASAGLLWLYTRARHGRNGHSYCSLRGCERVKITTTTASKQVANCTSQAYPKYSKTPSVPIPMPAPVPPCTRCGASKLFISSDPWNSYVRTHIKALSEADERKNDTRAFITVNAQHFNLTQTGYLVVLVDACTGKVVKNSFFRKLDSKMEQHLRAGIPTRSVVLLTSRGRPDGFAGVAQYLVPLGAAKVADLQDRESLVFFGFQGKAPSLPWVSLLAGRGEETSVLRERYIPLSLEEYSCPTNAKPSGRKDLDLLQKARS